MVLTRAEFFSNTKFGIFFKNSSPLQKITTKRNTTHDILNINTTHLYQFAYVAIYFTVILVQVQRSDYFLRTSSVIMPEHLYTEI